MTTLGASDLLAPEGANGKKEPSQVSIPSHSPQQIDEVLESTLTGLWIQKKMHLK